MEAITPCYRYNHHFLAYEETKELKEEISMLSIKQQTEVMLSGEAGEELQIASINNGEATGGWSLLRRKEGVDPYIFNWSAYTYRVKVPANWEIVKAAEEGAEIEFCAIDGQEWETKRSRVYWNFLETNYRVKK